jgi:hypothetical protein
MRTIVEKYIRELLYQYDCVIIPGFGGFIGNYSPALIDPVYHTFHPPYKSILFNINLKQNDGLLASCISQAEHIPYEHAMEMIRMMLADWNRELENGKELVIEKVGRIIKETNGILQFEQDNTVNYLPEAFGLTTLVSPAIRRPGMQEKLEKKLKHYSNANLTRTGKLSKTLRWAAIMALPLGLAAFLTISNMDQIRSFQQNYTGFLFPTSVPVIKKSAESPKNRIPSQNFIHPRQKNADIKQAETSTVVSQAVKLLVKETSAPGLNKQYAIIVGAFRFRENADNLVAKLNEEGYKAGIFDMTTTGLLRVSIGSYDSRSEAMEQLAIVRLNNCSSAWLLAK